MAGISAMILMTLIMTFAMVPRIYWSVLRAEGPGLEREKMRKLLVKRAWVLRHLRCSLAALFLVGMAPASPGWGVPRPLAAAIFVYAASSLLLVILESLLAQRIDGILAGIPVRVRVRD